MTPAQNNGCEVRPFNKQGNSEEMKVRGEGSDRCHFRQVEFEMPVEHPELGEEVCTRDRVLAMISCSIISMETCRAQAQENAPFVSKHFLSNYKLLLDGFNIKKLSVLIKNDIRYPNSNNL